VQQAPERVPGLVVWDSSIIITRLLCRALLERFRNQELISWADLKAEYEGELRKGDIFDQSEFGVKRWNTFKDRVVEHVIITLSLSLNLIQFQLIFS
jgi:hypothetical protein